MLLVKSKESKNSNNKFIKKRCITIFYIVLSTFLPLVAFAQSDESQAASSQRFINIFFSLLFVIAIILALAWLVRRFNVAQAANGQLKVIASLTAGTKEKIMVIEVGDEQHLLGVSATTINHLAKLEKPLVEEAKVSEAQTNDSQPSFQQKLVQAMAQNIQRSVGAPKQRGDAS